MCLLVCVCVCVRCTFKKKSRVCEMFSTVGMWLGFVCACPGLSVKVKVEVSKYTELLYIRYSIPTASL